MDYVIRQATSQDTTQISSLISQLTGKSISPLHIENRLHFMQSHPNESLYVYVEENQIRGTLGFRIRESTDSDLKFSEVSVLSLDEPSEDPNATDKLKHFAELLANKHACTGMWWVTGSERKNGTHALGQQLGFQETGYKFVKRFL
ncbi:GNAT family N-acetyltransferase [Paenibacillus sp. SYP-B3998]|uniref:GNAT family N-acetyltransferase n=1 Tax=Paenibacillus sp. SYP-B3998 TaxID=2678564 RepID=A0A6G4A0M5_9BACL|nr:GNAT family N-acetyltransferase [Paenibacillus sp. SYP-B3998]NEW07484.1 GNAT family N-acetyltransferase [Paenibacillus sp. SYP-B3998]